MDKGERLNSVVEQGLCPEETRARIIANAPTAIVEGGVYEAWWPFHIYNFKGPSPRVWGAGFERERDYDTEIFRWDGEGAWLYEIVVIIPARPGMAERALFKKHYRTPDGDVVRRSRLDVITSATIPKWCAGSKSEFLIGSAP